MLGEYHATSSDSVYIHYSEEKAPFLICDYLKKKFETPCLFLCIGTDKFIGDCLGPITGTFLNKLNIACPIFGTLENPVHAVNLTRTVIEIKARYPRHKIIAIDACLGTDDGIGHIQVRDGCIQPGRGVGKKLLSVGDLAIIGIVDSFCEADDSKYSSYFLSHNVRLNLVMKMAEVITKSIYLAYGT